MRIVAPIFFSAGIQKGADGNLFATPPPLQLHFLMIINLSIFGLKMPSMAQKSTFFDIHYNLFLKKLLMKRFEEWMKLFVDCRVA